MGVTDRFFDMTLWRKDAAAKGGTEMFIVMQPAGFYSGTLPLPPKPVTIFFLSTENGVTQTQETTVPSLSGVLFAFGK